MKANPIRDWTITLRGNRPTQTYTATHRGTIEAALAEADVCECQVNWQVRSIEIHASKPTA